MPLNHLSHIGHFWSRSSTDLLSLLDAENESGLGLINMHGVVNLSHSHNLLLPQSYYVYCQDEFQSKVNGKRVDTVMFVAMVTAWVIFQIQYSGKLINTVITNILPR